MKRIVWSVAAIGVCLLAFRVGPFVPAYAQDADWKKVDEILGRKPVVADDVHRYGFPRTDLSVTLDGVTIKPALALGGWLAFKPAHAGKRSTKLGQEEAGQVGGTDAGESVRQ